MELSSPSVAVDIRAIRFLRETVFIERERHDSGIGFQHKGGVRGRGASPGEGLVVVWVVLGMAF